METKKINTAQVEWYKTGECSFIDHYVNLYSGLIEEMQTKEILTILDVGGGAGYFARELLKRLLAGDSRVHIIDIYLIDTHRYDTWDDKDRRIHFIEEDAQNIDLVCKGIKFDYIFCNMLFHHLLGDSFKQSAILRRVCLGKMKSVLKTDGKIGIIDNLNDGFMWDSVSCRILYFLTTTKKPMIVKICKKMGSNSAGVGVCMLSRKMWYQLVESMGMNIVAFADSEPDRMGFLRHLCLLNKAYREFNLMVLQKRFGDGTI